MMGQRRLGRNLRRVAGLLAAAVAVPCLLADIQKPGDDSKKGGDDKKGGRAADNVRRATEIPRPKDQTVRALRGVPLQITLEAVSALRLPIEFRLGDAPRAGTLGPVVPAPESNERARVIYTPSPDSLAAEDTFTFRTKHPDSATSPSATVRILISDPKAVLEAPDKVDFGQAVVGESAVRTLAVRNSGTGAWRGRIDLVPPFRLVGGSPELELKPREATELRIAFSPLKAGPAPFALKFGAGLPTVNLAAVGAAPLTAAPNYLTLALDAETRRRSGEFTLTNIGALPAAFEIGPVPRLEVTPLTGEVAPGASVAVQVVIPDKDAGEFQGPLSVLSRGTQVAVPVSAKATPALVRVRQAEKMAREDGAWVLHSSENSAGFVLENAGGEKTTLFLEATPAGMNVIGLDDAGRDLEPGDVLRIGVLVNDDRREAPSGTLVFKYGEQQMNVPLRGVIDAAPASAPKAPARDPLLDAHAVPREQGEVIASEDRLMAPGNEQLRLMAAMLGVFPTGTKFDRSLPVIEMVGLRDVTPTSVKIAWKTLGPEYSHVVYRQSYRPLAGGGLPVRYWDPVPDAKFETKGDEIHMSLSDLKTGDRFALRFAVKTPDGRIGTPCGPLGVQLTIPKPRNWFLWTVILLAVAAGGWWWWRKRRAEAED